MNKTSAGTFLLYFGIIILTTIFYACTNNNPMAENKNKLIKTINDSINIEIQFSDNGDISIFKIINNKKDVELFCGFHDDGVTPCLVLSNKNGKPNGVYLTYYSTGILNNRVNYKDGELDGCYENFLENGKIRYRSYYVQGKEQNIEINDTIPQIKIATDE